MLFSMVEKRQKWDGKQRRNECEMEYTMKICLFYDHRLCLVICLCFTGDALTTITETMGKFKKDNIMRNDQ
jgi:hypothetical protein